MMVHTTEIRARGRYLLLEIANRGVTFEPQIERIRLALLASLPREGTP